ncbi:MAG: FtsX-like permease family protein, partial [Lewinella sp.]|nr:FtsX-like permease family protein [Lewinella sp.]
PPGNSSLQFDFLASFSSLRRLVPSLFENQRPALGSFITYFLLDETQPLETVTHQIETAINKDQEDKTSIFLKTLPDIYFSETTQRKLGLFAGIALLVLLLAIVNYAGLTTARSMERAREVGVRKTLGALRVQLIGQFFGESALMVMLSFIGALLVSWLGMPVVSRLAETRMDFQVFYQPGLLLAIGLILGLTIFLAGSYPALALSRFLPAGVLRGGRSNGLRGERTRRVLLVFQFVISAGLIVCSLVMQAQMRHLGNRDLGFNQDQLLVIPFEPAQEGAFGSLKATCLQEPGVASAGISTAVPFQMEGTSLFFVQTPEGDPISLYFVSVDHDFLSTLGVNWSQGTLAGPTLFGNGKRALINETAFRQMGLKTGLGEHILQSLGKEENQGYEITGIFKDYSFSDYKNPVGPQVLFEMNEADSRNITRPAYLTLRLEAGVEIRPMIFRLEEIYDGYQPVKPFEFFFVDDQYQQLYSSETRTASLFNLFTLLAISIACLGLFGLSAYLAERRTKEIGIRKVFGATVAQLVGLLSKDFIYLMGIALVIALPLAWYFMNRWLEDFAFRIELDWWLFALAAGLALGIAFLTVSFQSVRAALMNPVESLRSE